MRTNWAVLWPAAVLVLAGCTVPDARLEESDKKPAPAYSVYVFDRGTMDIAQLKGNAVLVVAWGLWCTSCHIELPKVQGLYAELKDRGFTVLAISIDPVEERDEVQADAQRMELEFYVGHDPDGRQFIPAWKNLGTPDNWLLDPEGFVVGRWNGQFDPDDPEQRAAVEAVLPV